ncbi:hypothetical protein ACXYMU_18795 [Pontibacter sp. CAU 1760]
MMPTLQFVYNAKTGLFNKLTDFAHKAIAPKTYDCNLCVLTYGTFAMKDAWATYLKSLPFPAEFIYRDKWKFRDGKPLEFPLVALQTTENQVEVLLQASQLNRLQSLEELKQALNQALIKYNAHS